MNTFEGSWSERIARRIARVYRHFRQGYEARFKRPYEGDPERDGPWLVWLVEHSCCANEEWAQRELDAVLARPNMQGGPLPELLLRHYAWLKAGGRDGVRVRAVTTAMRRDLAWVVKQAVRASSENVEEVAA